MGTWSKRAWIYKGESVVFEKDMPNTKEEDYKEIRVLIPVDKMMQWPNEFEGKFGSKK